MDILVLPQALASSPDASCVKLQGLKKRYEDYPDVVEPHPSKRNAQFKLAGQAAESCQTALNRLQKVKPSAGSKRSLLLTGLLIMCCVALGVWRSTGVDGDSWLSSRLPLPSREQAGAALRICAQEVRNAFTCRGGAKFWSQL